MFQCPLHSYINILWSHKCRFVFDCRICYDCCNWCRYPYVSSIPWLGSRYFILLTKWTCWPNSHWLYFQVQDLFAVFTTIPPLPAATPHWIYIDALCKLPCSQSSIRADFSAIASMLKHTTVRLNWSKQNMPRLHAVLVGIERHQATHPPNSSVDKVKPLTFDLLAKFLKLG